MSEPLDHQKLLAEIDAEVRRKRETGEIPADLERELDLVFARFAPVDALEADFEQVLTRAEQATFIDVIAPVESSRPVVPYFKKVVRKLIGWYLRYVANQTTTFAHAIARAVRLLGERVDALEAASPLAAGDAALRAGPEPADLAEWAPVVVEWVRSAPGRVMHGEVGDGTLLDALVLAGVDAYGVDPAPRSTVTHEVREDEVTVHLRAVADAALGAVVLAGCVDRTSLGVQLDLADLAAAKVRPGGVVAVVSRHPDAWQRSADPVQVDLSPGRPLHPETWQHVLAERGFTDVEVVLGRPDEDGLEPVPRGNAVLNANLERLNSLLFGPASFAVFARRSA